MFALSFAFYFFHTPTLLFLQLFLILINLFFNDRYYFLKNKAQQCILMILYE